MCNWVLVTMRIIGSINCIASNTTSDNDNENILHDFMYSWISQWLTQLQITELASMLRYQFKGVHFQIRRQTLFSAPFSTSSPNYLPLVEISFTCLTDQLSTTNVSMKTNGSGFADMWNELLGELRNWTALQKVPQNSFRSSNTHSLRINCPAQHRRRGILCMHVLGLGEKEFPATIVPL